MSARAWFEEFRAGLKKPPTFAPTRLAPAASQRVSLLFIYFFLLIKNKNNNKYTPGWMDWIEIPLHEFAGFLANSTLAHRRGVNGLLSKFHHTIPIFRYKLLFQSMLPMKKAGWTGFGGPPTLPL